MNLKCLKAIKLSGKVFMIIMPTFSVWITSVGINSFCRKEDQCLVIEFNNKCRILGSTINLIFNEHTFSLKKPILNHENNKRYAHY